MRKLSKTERGKEKSRFLSVSSSVCFGRYADSNSHLDNDSGLNISCFTYMDNSVHPYCADYNTDVDVKRSRVQSDIR